MRRNTTGERYFINRPGAPKPAHHVPIEGTIDLHPFEPQDICSVVNEYVREAYKAGFEEIRLFTAVVTAHNEELSRRPWNGILWSIPLETHRKATSEQPSPHYVD